VTAARAAALAGVGREAEAVAAIQAGIAANEPDALVLAAQWRLFGAFAASLGPRDPAAAKALLARAADAGDLSARVLLAYLTANPACGEPDPVAARGHLALAAPALRQLGDQLALYDGLVGRPLPPPERLSDRPDLVRWPGLLTAAECAWLIAAAQARLAPSLVVDPVTGVARADPVRRARAMSFGPLDEDLAVGAIADRIAAASGTDRAAAEPLAVLAYGARDEYRPHLDTVPGLANQRAVTVLTYLNDDFAGGETVFDDGPTVAPRTGDAIVFRVADASGQPLPEARHAGAPVTRGVKYLCSRWIRLAAHDIWAPTNMRESAP
jgi:prolyl 4-hydroxylase